MICTTCFDTAVLFLQLLTYGRRIPFAEFFARIDAVDANTVKRVANRIIYDRVTKFIVVRLKHANYACYSGKLAKLPFVSLSAGCCYCCHGPCQEVA